MPVSPDLLMYDTRDGLSSLPLSRELVDSLVCFHMLAAPTMIHCAQCECHLDSILYYVVLWFDSLLLEELTG